MVKNVMIPLFPLKRVIEFLDCLDIPEYHDLRYEYCEILWALKLKIHKLELRGAYSKIILVEDEEMRDFLRNYNPQVRYQLKDMEEDEIF